MYYHEGLLLLPVANAGETRCATDDSGGHNVGNFSRIATRDNNDFVKIALESYF